MKGHGLGPGTPIFLKKPYGEYPYLKIIKGCLFSHFYAPCSLAELIKLCICYVEQVNFTFRIFLHTIWDTVVSLSSVFARVVFLSLSDTRFSCPADLDSHFS